MGAGDELSIGKIATSTDSYSMGMEGNGIGTTPMTLPNSDYNSFRANRTNNNNAFLSLTAQQTTVGFDSRSIDFTFNDGAGSVGMNPFFQAPSTATKVFTA